MAHSPSPVDEKAKFSDDDVRFVAEDDPQQAIVSRFGALGPWLDRLFASGVEARGVERVPESERETKNVWNKYVS